MQILRTLAKSSSAYNAISRRLSTDFYTRCIQQSRSDFKKMERRSELIDWDVLRGAGIEAHSVRVVDLYRSAVVGYMPRVLSMQPEQDRLMELYRRAVYGEEPQVARKHKDVLEAFDTGFMLCHDPDALSQLLSLKAFRLDDRHEHVSLTSIMSAYGNKALLHGYYASPRKHLRYYPLKPSLKEAFGIGCFTQDLFASVIEANEFECFRLACKGGDLETVEMQWHAYVKFESQFRLMESFRTRLLDMGHYFAPWMFNPIDVPSPEERMLSADNFGAFRNATESGNMTVAKFLMDKCPQNLREHMLYGVLPSDKNSTLYSNQPLRLSCKNRHMEVAAWLWGQYSPRKREGRRRCEPKDNMNFTSLDASLSKRGNPQRT